jgi:hypothetical protein
MNQFIKINILKKYLIFKLIKKKLIIYIKKNLIIITFVYNKEFLLLIIY